MNLRTLPFLVLLLAPPWAVAEEQAPGTTSADAGDDSWLDNSQEAMSNRTQALTEWLDGFFGDPNFDVERAESYLRLQLIDKWDEDDGNDTKVRLRGKVELPKLSRRLAVVFAGDDDDDSIDGEGGDDSFGLQWQIDHGGNSRFDATLAWGGGDVRPGLRFRNQGPVTEDTSYRWIQRLEYDRDENLFTTGLVDLNQSLSDTKLLRWSNRVMYGEETDGVEWRTRLSLRQVWNPEAKRPVAINYYASINGITQPDQRVKNYRLGLQWRRRVYRDFLYLTLEPAWNYRQRQPDEERAGAWSFAARLEIDLHQKSRDRSKQRKD
ncbi:hypothetical protein [Haliea sp. E17]|uniref:hypothetical protein n=1 Tax=Haliea sp. E17 TaxID=3401576 RepID=UPI003AADEE41